MSARPLDIIVCMKPVPDPRHWGRLKLDPETLLLVRSNVPVVINPLDRHAIEQAVALVEQRGGTASVVAMAPPDAEDRLLEAMAMGCDRAWLLSDPAFAGADTLATARCLAAAIDRIGHFDLVFCGAYSADGSTAQVGPQLAELLGVPDLSCASRLELDGMLLRATCALEQGHAVLETDLPALVTFAREANTPRRPSAVGIMKASRTGVVTWGAADLGLDPGVIGLRGSPTQMLNVFTAGQGRKGEMLQGTPNEMAARLLAKLRRDRVLDRA